MTGLVIRSTGSWYNVQEEKSRKVVECRLRGSYRLRGSKQTNPIAVGDWVDYELCDDGTGVIHEVHERKNYIIRKATKLSKQTHVIAANIDLLCVVATVSMPRTSTGFIDRLLATAEAYHIPSCLIINKIDLLTEADDQAYKDWLSKLYTTAGYRVYETSALYSNGIAELREAMSDKTVLLSGHSGVGKSALLSALCPGLEIRIGEISEWTEKGKHTTTFAEIYPVELPGAGACRVIDTPGIKEFGMVEMNANEVSHYFPEMRARVQGCHFSNCTHRHEPGCAIKEAVENGEISEERYTNYINIINDIINQ